MSEPPVTQTVPVAPEAWPTLKLPEELSRLLVSPAMVNVPREPVLVPTYMSRARNVPLEIIIWPTPDTPTSVSLLVTTSSPPVTHTAPVAAGRPPTLRSDVNVLVPPATVNVPTEPVLVPTYRLRVRNVPLEI